MRPRAVYSWLCWAAFLPSLQGEGGQVQDPMEGQDEGAGRPLEAFFTTQPRQEMVNEGGEIRLPCFVEDWGDFVLVWKFAAAFSNNSAIEDMTLSVGQRVIEERDQGRQVGNGRSKGKLRECVEKVQHKAKKTNQCQTKSCYLIVVFRSARLCGT